MYQVGFGDCFLVCFRYSQALADGRRERFVLVDFGSTEWPEDHAPRYPEIAEDMKTRTGGKLDAIVVTHRHKDHLSGFANDKAGAILEGLQPSVVLRPWTENPTAAADATGPALVGPSSRRFARGLTQAQAFAEAVTKAVPGTARGFRGELRELALHELANQKAITRLDGLASATASGGDYLFAGQPSGLEALLPGVKVHVLGPPTIDQWEQVAGDREDDPEYWLRQRGLLARMLAAVEAPPDAVRVAETAGPTIDPGPVRWIVERLHDQQIHSLLRIVRELDGALNNTSVILLFEVGRRKLLFPGDAQIENWSYALASPSAAALRAALPEVDFYKVGHHGSRNATPRSLVGLWSGRAKPLTSALSTLSGVHGETDETAVPRQTLCDALAALGTLHRTDELPAGTIALELTASTRNEKPFVVV
jgi:hypothetical protein